MRFKVDENLHPDASAFLVELGHDALTVWDQNLQGTNDPRLADVCRNPPIGSGEDRSPLERAQEEPLTSA
jgi:Domain of unknown function (DUF5615)